MKKIFKYICLLFMLANLINIFAFADNAETNIENGLYSLDVVLWHAYEDKASMGAGGIENKANLFVQDEKMILYLRAKPMSVGNLTTSVDRFYYPVEKESSYKLADTYIFEIEIKGESKKRPRIFSFEIFSKDEFLNVMIDPKVEQMGNEPIKARLKIDWSSLKKIEQAGSLYDRAINDNTNDILQNEFKNQSIRVLLDKPTKDQVSINSISRKTIEDSNLEIGILDSVEGFEIMAKDENIAFDNEKTNNMIDIGNFSLEYTEGKFDVTEVYFSQNGEFQPIEFKRENGKAFINNAKQGVYAFVNRKGDNNLVTATKNNETIINKNIPMITKPSISEVKPVNTNEIKNIIKENKQSNIGENNIGNELEKTDNSDVQKELTTNVPSQIVMTPKKVENYGIVFVIAMIYLAFLISGIVIGAKFVPKLLNEFERSRYIEDYSKGAKK